MNTPPFLLAAAALFWGWQTGNWLIAAVAAALLEAPRYVARRWNLENTEFNRVSDFCTVLLAGVALYLYFTFGNPRAITLLFLWMPLVLLPLALAQAWSTSRDIDLSVLFWSLRRNPMRRPSRIDLGYPAFSLWLLGASAANLRTDGFYVGLSLLVAWPLWLARPRSFRSLVWAGTFALAVLAGYGAHGGLNRTQAWLEAAAPEWMAGSGARTNPYRNTTDIGSIGDLKQSERIVLRVHADAGFSPPILLHRASYDNYAGGVWLARNARFEQLAPFGSASNWQLSDAQQLPARLTVHDYSADGNPVLSLPAGTARIEGLSASEMKANSLGAVQVEHKPGFFSYRVQSGPVAAAYGAPLPQDLDIPKAEAAAITQIAQELRLASLPPEQALATVKNYFDGRFEYATWQGKAADGRSPLAEFLLATRAGHCEYFATATVLLLRAAGIPARYATGFSAQEFSKLEGAYVVRERHAHAWVRAWVGGKWQDIDTTPASWLATESAQAPLWAPISDLWAWLRFSLAQWSARSGDRGWDAYLAWLALPLIMWLAWRTFSGRRADVKAPTRSEAQGKLRPGEDSEFYLVEKRIAELGHARQQAQALSEWLASIRAQAGLEPEALQRLARLHNRHRFDPEGLPVTERESLREQAIAWLARHPVALGA